MDARGIMEPNDQIQPVSRAEQRHQRKEMKKAMKDEKIGQKEQQEKKIHKMDLRPRNNNQKINMPIQQARLNNH